MAKVAILGFGKEGQSSAQYWKSLGHTVEVRDAKQSIDQLIPSEYSQKLGEAYLNDLSDFDVIVRSPGLHPSKMVDENPQAPDILNRVTTSTNEFLSALPEVTVIGVTGTKGKGTTATLIAKILEAAGENVHFGGNIGITILDQLPKIAPRDYVVLEMSSFQLYDMKHRINTAVCLTIKPEHLNWHADYEDYLNAKANIFRFQHNEDRAIYNHYSDTSTNAANISAGSKIAYAVPPLGDDPVTTEGAYEKGGALFFGDVAILPISDVALPGRHNLENICAAIAAVWSYINNDIEALRSVLTTFKGLDDHLELVDVKHGVTYINDTYATAPDAAIAAFNSYQQPKIMILGGIDKKVPLEPLVDAVIAGNTRGVVLIDDLARQLAGLFADRSYEQVQICPTMSQAVTAASVMAQDGDVVLLSPGCAGNGGMFTDKLDRGRQFNQAVREI